MDPVVLLVIVLASALVGSYVLGASLNASRTRSAAEALRAVLREPASGSGGARPVERLGRAVVRVTGVPRVAGTGVATATLLLTPREALLSWLLWIVQRRGDQVDLRVELDRPPRGAGLLCDTGHRLGRAALRAGLDGGGTATASDGRLTIVTYDAGGLATMRRLAPIVGAAPGVILLELRAAQPRLTMVLSIDSGTRAIASVPSLLAQVVREAAPDQGR